MALIQFGFFWERDESELQLDFTEGYIEVVLPNTIARISPAHAEMSQTAKFAIRWLPLT